MILWMEKGKIGDWSFSEIDEGPIVDFRYLSNKVDQPIIS